MSNPTPGASTRRLSHLGPLSCGCTLGLAYGLLGLLLSPLTYLGFVSGAGGQQGLHLGLSRIVGLAVSLFIPVLYGAIGFILGAISALIYNLAARWTGGVEFRTTDSPAS